MTRILFSSSTGIDSRHPKRFRDHGEFGINLCLVLRNRELLLLHFFGNRKDLLFLLLGCARSFGRRRGDQQSKGEKDGKSWKVFHECKIVHRS